MRTYLKRQCLFDVSIGALSEPESYEENIDWINNCDIYYGIILFGNVSKYTSSHRFCWVSIWALEQFGQAFGMQEVEDEAWSEPNISSCFLSKYFLAYKLSYEFIHDE